MLSPEQVQRKQAIDNCIQWVEELGQRNSDYFSHVINLDKISFQVTDDTPTTKNELTSSSSSSYRPPMVGVFAKTAIAQGEILVTISQDCIVNECHPLLEDLARQVVDQAMTVYRDNVTSLYSQERYKYSPWDPFYHGDKSKSKSKSKGRVFQEDELRLALHMTLLLFVHRQRQQQETSNYQEAASSTTILENASIHWSHYLDTLPQNYESLIFYWTHDEMDNLKGTSCHTLAQRLRAEAHENWEQSFRDVLVDYLQKQQQQQQQPTNNEKELDEEFLRTCYMDAICTIYSRMHALEVISGETTAQNNSRCTCPLVDLINGDRDGSPACNTLLLHYPGTHVALQATRDIVVGEELMFSYGQVANQVFVTKFGFLPLDKHGNPRMDPLDVVHILPPPNLVWEADDRRWKTLTSERDGKALERRHLIETPPYVTAECGTPFALMGDKLGMGKVRTSDTWRPHYLANFHLYAMMSLTTEDDLNAAEPNSLIEPWEPGAIIMEMIDYRMERYQKASSTSCLSQDKELLHNQKGNMRTGTHYRMLEREILIMWRHAIALHYDVYGEPNSKGEVFQPLLLQGVDDTNKRMCATCHASLAGPLKCCTQCKTVYYCSRVCQKEDWKGGHKEACRPAPKT